MVASFRWAKVVMADGLTLEICFAARRVFLHWSVETRVDRCAVWQLVSGADDTVEVWGRVGRGGVDKVTVHAILAERGTYF